jgi:hypothetical protein
LTINNDEHDDVDVGAGKNDTITDVGDCIGGVAVAVTRVGAAGTPTSQPPPPPPPLPSPPPLPLPSSSTTPLPGPDSGHVASGNEKHNNVDVDVVHEVNDTHAPVFDGLFDVCDAYEHDDDTQVKHVPYTAHIVDVAVNVVGGDDAGDVLVTVSVPVITDVDVVATTS